MNKKTSNYFLLALIFFMTSQKINGKEINLLYNDEISTCTRLRSALNKIITAPMRGTDYMTPKNIDFLAKAGFKIPEKIPPDDGEYIDDYSGDFSSFYVLTIPPGNTKRIIYFRDRCNYCLNRSQMVVLSSWYILKEDVSPSVLNYDHSFPDSNIVAFSDDFDHNWRGLIPLNEKSFIKSAPRYQNSDSYRTSIDILSRYTLGFVRPFVDIKGTFYILGSEFIGSGMKYDASFTLYRFSPDFLLDRICIFTKR